MKRPIITVDGTEAVALVAHKINEVIAIYPITPSSGMGEFADAWSAVGKTNIWGTVPLVVEMQSEGGAAGAVHGALQAGALTTTFTASQGLLLMIPNMYKIAGELTSTVFHVSARSLAAQALSIFGDHSDVTATRSTGFALLSSGSVQEAHDFALIAQAATLESRVPFLHFFEGFRVSHEVNKIEQLTDEDLKAMIDDELVRAHRARGLSPDRPVLRGTAQNPDVYFQARETVNPYYEACPAIVQQAMDKFAALTGRQYHNIDYFGAPDAERVIVMMGCGAVTASETAKYLNEAGEKLGVIAIRLYRPFPIKDFLKALPETVKTIAVLDRTKEPGSTGEPLFLDVSAAIVAGLERGTASFTEKPRIIGGRYGLSSKEFTPAMVKGVFDEMTSAKPKNSFATGIYDDVTNNSIDYDPNFSIEDPQTVRAVFFGLGSDGTVGANKNSIKIIGEETDNHAQGFFNYDSKKSGAVTVSHLRFGPKPIRAPYLIENANFVACHQFSFLERIDMLKYAEPKAVFLLNSFEGPDEVWDFLPRPVQETIIEKKLRFYVIDGYQVAEESGMGRRINTIMQTCFFAISGVLPREQAIKAIKDAIQKTYGKRGEAVVKRNFEAVDKTLAKLFEVDVPAKVTSKIAIRKPVPDAAPDFVRDVLGEIIAGRGDALPVSAFPVDGTFPTATTQWEKRNIALEIPEWDPDICIQCGKCVFVCPHAVIREKVFDPTLLEKSPPSFLSADARWREFPNMKYTLSVSPEDCTGCALCIEACPAKDKTQVGRKAINMVDQLPIREREVTNWDFFLTLPEVDRTA
ncbi:MAG: pyruvate:ferredoxin (flavodoxin) oxidoreductase, partial [Anaerolineales bacterium]